jgi:hypothetical protein
VTISSGGAGTNDSDLCSAKIIAFAHSFPILSLISTERVFYSYLSHTLIVLDGADVEQILLFGIYNPRTTITSIRTHSPSLLLSSSMPFYYSIARASLEMLRLLIVQVLFQTESGTLASSDNLAS